MGRGLSIGVDRPLPATWVQALVGREPELAAASRLLEAADGVGVLFLHGPGGIGKSALARALGGLAAQRGHEVFSLDARDLPPSPDALQEELGAGLGARLPLIVLDSFELVEASAGYLRDEFVPNLPPRAVVVIAGRNPPDPAWFAAGWEERVLELRLRPLVPADAERLLSDEGLTGPRAERLLAWAQGHPLALKLGGRIALDDASWTPGSDQVPDELVGALVRRLGETDVGAGHLPALAAASIARSTTPALLAAALPQHDAAAEWEWLSARSFVEPVGEGIALHALLRDALRADLKRRDPLLEGDLKRRIADHVYGVAEESGELNRVLDLSHLIENPGLRFGFFWEASARYYVDGPRPGDAAEIDRLLADPPVEPVGGSLAAWELTRPFFERMPELGVVVRDPSGRIAGFTFVPTTAADDEALEQAPLLGPCLRHARGLTPRGEAVVMPYMCDLTGDVLSGIIGMLANAALLRSSRSNPRYAYMTIDPEIELARAFAEMAGGERVPELDAELGTSLIQAWLIDFGPGGFLANQRELVYRELNLEPPPRPPESLRLGLRRAGSRRPAQPDPSFRARREPACPGRRGRGTRRVRPRPACRGRRVHLRQGPYRGPLAQRPRSRLPRSRGQPRARRRGALSVPLRLLPPPQAGRRAPGRVPLGQPGLRRVDLQPEHAPRVLEAVDQAVDLLARRVDAEARAGGGGDAEPVHQRLGAVVAGAHRHAVAIEDLGDVVGVDAVELERDRARGARRRRRGRRPAGPGPRPAAPARRR